MRNYLKQWIQEGAAQLDRDANMSAEEYAKVPGASCESGNYYACQMGAVQARARYLLLTLWQAGLYDGVAAAVREVEASTEMEQDDIDPETRALLDESGNAPPYSPELQ